MSSWRPAGSHSSPPWQRHDEHPGRLPAPPPCGAGGQASQPFPVPNVTAAIANYLASHPSQPDIGWTGRPPIDDIETCHHPPHHGRRASATPVAPTFAPPPPSFSSWTLRPNVTIPGEVTTPVAPTFGPPPPSFSPWTVRPNVTIPGEVVGISSGDTTGADDAPGGLRVARRAGCRAAGQGRNFIASPLSFHAALGLVADGANGETRRELLGFLVGSASLAALHRAAATKLVGVLRSLPQTSFACGVWVDRRRALMPEFAEVAGALYAAVAESVDFVSQAEQARQRVNAFVTGATNGLIRDVLPPGSVDASTVVVLANALYFKGAWSLPFFPSATFAAPFHLPDGTTVRAPFMTSTFDQHVAVFPDFRAVKLPYKNDDGGGHQVASFHMLLLLPDNATLGLGRLYDKVVSTPEFIRKHTPAARVPVGRFMVPKFKFTFEFEASEDIQNLGVTSAFGGGDFSGMVTGGYGLYISGVYHKATIEVDELGTVAAAATAVCIQECMSVRPPVDFVADRPFLFAVVEGRSGALLFFGHVVNPLAE